MTPSQPITCLACSHVFDVGCSTGEATLSSADFCARNIFRCAECGARMVYGALARVHVVEPHMDDHGRTWVRVRTQNPITREDVAVDDFDPPHAARFALEILSMVVP